MKKIDGDQFAEFVRDGGTIVDIAERLEAAEFWKSTRYENADERTILRTIGRILRTAKTKTGMRRFGCYPASYGR